MRMNSNHVSDQDLVGFADGELSAARAAKVEEHLEACWKCRARRSEFESAVTSLVKMHQESFESRIPSAAGPRALLKLRLDEAASAPRRAPRFGFSFLRTRTAYAAAFAVVLVSVALLYGRIRSTAAESKVEPDRELTPGAVRPVSLSEICSGGPSDKNRTVPRSVQLEVFRKYGIPNARPEDYEVDYLITPELGGSDDIRNLWPQPFLANGWTAYVKDDLEDRLHDMVCHGDLDLSTAQREIARDWVSAYKRYFQTDKPLLQRTAEDANRPKTVVSFRPSA
jgi:hypothetical protein